MDFDEASFVYMQGLHPRVRELVRTKDGIKDIRKLMLACLKLDIQSDKTEKTSEAYTVENKKATTSKSKSKLKLSSKMNSKFKGNNRK